MPPGDPQSVTAQDDLSSCSTAPREGGLLHRHLMSSLCTLRLSRGTLSEIRNAGARADHRRGAWGRTWTPCRALRLLLWNSLR